MYTLSKVSTKMQQIAQNAERMPHVSFTSLSYHLDMEWMYEAYKETRKDGAVGVDGQTAKEFQEDLKGNLDSLLELAKSGKYKAPPVRRTYIPKPGSKEERPLGIPTFSDKVLQKAVKWLIEPIYETEFYDCSYGFRPNRSQHLALKSLWEGLMDMKGGWIIDLDIRKYFDSIKWTYLCDILKQRVRDGVLIRLIGKWMNAGIMEGGELEFPDKGVPQGAVISPLLSNIFLHEVMDKWFHEVVLPRLQGKTFEVRFADDVMLCFENKADALRVMEVLPKRLAKFGLKLHPEKTKLVNFERPQGNERDYRRETRPDTFSFLSFTHFWKKSRNGRPVIGRKTKGTRMSTALQAMNNWCRKNRHKKLKEQHEALCRKVSGHYAYFGITGNYVSIKNYVYQVERIWRKWLGRRSWKDGLNWERMRKRVLNNYPLPRPRIVVTGA